MTRGVNPDAIETIEIRDTNEHVSTTVDIRTVGRALCKIVNSLYQDISVTLQGTTFDDPEFEDPVSIGTNGLSVGAGETGYLTTNDPFSYLRVKVKADTAPTDGDVKLVWEFKHGKD